MTESQHYQKWLGIFNKLKTVIDPILIQIIREYIRETSKSNKTITQEQVYQYLRNDQIRNRYDAAKKNKGRLTKI